MISAMPNIFTYGSLMFPQVWPLVVAGSYRKTGAVLRGYERKGVKGEVYPVLVPSSPYSQVHGVVYFDVSPDDLSRLDIFEGEYYFRKTEQVTTEDAEAISAGVYILKEEYYTIISPHGWDAEQFEKTGLHFFIDKYLDNGS